MTERELEAMYVAWKALYAVNGSRMDGPIAPIQEVLRDALVAAHYKPFTRLEDLPKYTGP